MKRDLQGKFALKNDEHRQIRSLRITDATWKGLGMAAECLGLTRADLLELSVRAGRLTGTDEPSDGTSADVTTQQLQAEIETLQAQVRDLTAQKGLRESTIATQMVAQLMKSQERVLWELKVGKQSRDYKLVKKSLQRLIELAAILPVSSM